MINAVSRWYQRKFSNPESVTLLTLLVFVALALFLFGKILLPVLVAIVLAYLLDWPVNQFEKFGLSRSLSITTVLLLFTGIMVLATFGLIPTIWQQGVNLVNEMPQILAQGKNYLLSLPESYPDYVNLAQIEIMLQAVSDKLLTWGEGLLSASLNSLVNVMALLIYLILVPLMVFFMLKDKGMLLSDSAQFLPQSRRLVKQVWTEFNGQVINYIRGKVLEILIVGGVSVITFAILDLRYAVLLGVLVGFSVLIPYIGAAVVTIPVAVVALFQWGVTSDFWYVIVAYGIIQALDGNLLVPLLFSEAVNLHPLLIIVAVLFFGGLWGFWGVFFAIPLATLVKALINAWGDQPPVEEAS